MLRWFGLLVILGFVSGTGCGTLREKPEFKDPWINLNSSQRENADESAYLVDVAFVERPMGDYFLNKEIWDLSNEQGVDLETKPHLEKNGIRVCTVGGLVPPRLQALMRSPASCPNPRRLWAYNDQPTPILIGKSKSQIEFPSHEPDKVREVRLEMPQCFIDVTPRVRDADSIQLSFKPRIKHGKSKAEAFVSRDSNGLLKWSMETRDSVEEFPFLCWDMTIAPGEMVVVGTNHLREKSLGSSLFLDPESRTQTMLVVRISRVGDNLQDQPGYSRNSPPLALQASWTARGTSR
ncbi:MAG: hypothetical protein ACKO23_12335 [Gemmataceae bacterium]